MCLILLAHRAHPRYRLVLAANRDEYYDRPTAPLAWWDDLPHVLAGRDLKAGGTWLGVTPAGRLAAVTNYREPKRNRAAARSRGLLVTDFLNGSRTACSHLMGLQADAASYNGFGLVIWDCRTLCFFSNRGPDVVELESGIYGLSNHLLDTPWPKVDRGKAGLRRELAGQGELSIERIFGLLADPTPAQDDVLPDTGVGIELERRLSPIFIRTEGYGTRSTSVVVVEESGHVRFVERTYSVAPGRVGDFETCAYAFELASS